MKHKTLNIALFVVAVLLVGFIVTMIVTFWKFQQIPDVLVTCVLGTGTAELIATACIEIAKKHFAKKEGQNERTDYVDNQESFEG